MDIKTVGPWAVRMLLLALGGWLTRAIGFGDAGLWGNIADTLAGPIVVAGTALWSWRATKAQVATVPEVAGIPVAQMVAQTAASTSAAVDEIAALRREIAVLSSRPAA